MLGIGFVVALVMAVLSLWFFYPRKTPPSLLIQVNQEESQQQETKETIELLTQQVKVAWWGGALIVGFGLSILLANFFLTFLVLVTNYFVMKMYLFQKERALREKAKELLGPALLNLGASYRTKKNWREALKITVPLLEEPLQGEFQRALQIHESGVPIGEVFQQMMERMKEPDMSLFVTMAKISEKIGEKAAEGILASGARYQTRRLAKMDIENAMMKNAKENQWLMYIFFGVVIAFRMFAPQFFSVYTEDLAGQILLTVYLTIAVATPVMSYRIIRKEV